MTTTKPVRLDFMDERRDKRGHIKQNAVWIVRDGTKRISTGCRYDERKKAEDFFRQYLGDKHRKSRSTKCRAAEDIPIRDVLKYYEQRSQDVARPKALADRLRSLLLWWGDQTLADITGHTCEAYAIDRGAQAAARRELEDLSAAIARYCRQGLCREKIVVTLPPKSKAREAHFTREQIAALIWFCLTYRTTHKGKKTRHRSLLHIIPFILVAVYTGTRSARVWNASFEKEPGRPWIDLEHGIFYRIGDEETRHDNKRADPIPIPERLLRHMRWWQQGRLIDGMRTPKKYLVEWHGRAADPKKALSFAMQQCFGENHGFVRHSFRHTCATWLLWEGKHSEEEIAAYLSMTVQMLRKVYGHPHPERHRKIAESFSNGSAGRRQRNPRGHRYGRAEKAVGA